MERFDGFRIAADLLLQPAPTPHRNRKDTSFSPDFLFKKPGCLLQRCVVGSRRRENELAQFRSELFRLANFGFEFVYRYGRAVVVIFAFALDADEWAAATAAITENVNAVLALSNSAVVLRVRIIQHVLTQQARR